ncbi:Phage major tail protein TP901-1 [uncultured Caudovirales phage]|uniref:Phage major tail protein TP901-1 n=1 Tax=uncultured Caudovirales phage TaxID=2100421 RepID=A0A6J5SLK2_9CAUD|nr:Phage major tail protein TP901-1 [uncultured Caudovirales phage]
MNGTACRISVGGVTLATAKSENFQNQMATRDTTTKDSGNFKEIDGALISYSFDASGLFNLSNTATSPQDLQDKLIDRTPVAVVFMSGAIAGTRSQSGSAYVTDITFKADTEGNVEWTCKFEGTGALTTTDN